MSETEARKLSLVYQEPQASTVRPEFGTPSQPEQDSFVPAHMPHTSIVALLNKMPSHPTHEELVPAPKHHREPGRIERCLRPQ